MGLTNKPIGDIHIITWKGKWGVYKRKSYRSLRNFKFRDLAFHFATKYKTKIIVHNSDGGVDFIYDNIS